MPKPLTTLQALPETEMTRFSQLALGADRVSTIREEFLALRRVASCLIPNKPIEQLTLDDVQQVAIIVDSRAQMTVNDLQVGIRDAMEALQTDPLGEAASLAGLDLVMWLLAARARK